MKKMKTESGLHEIKNKKRLRAVRDKKKGVSLRRVKSRRKAKAVASLFFVGVVGLAAFAFMGGNPDLNIISKDYVTVSSELPTDGSTPLSHTGIENIAYMNYRLKTQPEWYSHAHSDVKTNMGSLGDQSVDTYKQFSNGVLVQTDIATSTVVNEAQQFCWVPNDANALADFTDGIVMWRSTTKNKSSWTDYSMPWPDGSFSFNRKSINDFTYGCAEEGQKEMHNDEINGLPGTAFSVYVIREETVESVEDLVELDGGLYSQTFHLRVKSDAEGTDDSAVCHYRNQMIFKGGLSALPSFDYVTVTYTFDSSWQIYTCDVKEHYFATMSAISVSCTSTSSTVFEYGTEKSQHTAYENYFKYQYDKPVTDGSKEISSLDCLASAFGSVLTEPTTFALSLNVDGYTVNGLVGLDVSTMDIRASIQDGAIRVWYTDDGVYLAYGGLKLKLDAEELMPLFSGDASPSDGNSGEGGLSLDFLLEEIANAELQRDGDKACIKTSLDLSSIINGLKVSDLEFRFDIGENNSVTLDYLTANIDLGSFTIGARLSFSDEKLPGLPEAEKSDYTNGLPFVKSIAEIVKGGAVDISLDYAVNDVSVAGTVSLSFKGGLAVQGALTVEYGGAEIPVSLYYAGGEIYANVYGLKIKTSTKSLLEIIPKSEGSIISKVLSGLFSKETGKAFALGEEGGVLALTVDGSELLRNLLGVNFDLGDITIAAEDDALAIKALGANIEVRKGSQFGIDEDFTAYVDISSALPQIVNIVKNGAISLSADMQFAFGGTAVSLAITEGAVSWKHGLNIYLDILLGVNGVEQNVILKANENSVKIAYGSVGVDLAFNEFGKLEEAFKELYGKLRNIINQTAEQGGFLPEDYQDLFSLLGSVLDLTELMGGETDGFDLGGLIGAIAIFAPETENGICKITYENLIAELLGGKDGFGVKLGYVTDSLNVAANLNLNALQNTIPAMPEADYLTVADFAEMFDYVAAAANTLAQTELQVTVSATTSSAEKGNTVIDATVLYHTDGDVLFKIDTDNTTVTVTTNLYLSVSLSIVSENSDTNTYLDLLVFDYGNDNELDFFVRLSRFGSKENDERYEPLLLSAPASEIMTVLSAGVALFGINSDVLNNYLVYHWLEAETTEQLLAFGDILKKSLGLENGFLGLFTKDEAAPAVQPDGISEAFIRSIVLDKENGTFTLALNSSAVYGKEELEDITFRITKENGLLGAISLNNVYSGNASEVTNVSVEFGANVEKTQPAWLSECFKITGVNQLLKALANTAAHEETKEDGTSAYVMNDNFFINGVVSVKLTAIGIVNIDFDVNLAVSVDLKKDGSVFIKVRLDYKGLSVPLVGTAINGEYNWLDLTIDLQESMVYMKRVEESKDKKYTTEYRAMPLNVFVQDIMNQLAFMLNFGSLITDNLPANLSSGSGEQEVVDYGTIKSQYLNGLDFAGNENDGYQWTMKLNGSKLTGGAMNDIVVTLASVKGETGHILKTLGLSTTVSVSVVKIEISTDNNPLTIRNPKGVMESGYSDETDNNLAAKLLEAIGKAYDEAEENGWLKVDENGKPVQDENGNFTYIYISGVLTTVSYMLGDELLGIQNVLFDGNTYELYANLSYPDTSAYAIEGYSIVWDKIEGKISPNQVIYAHYAPDSYNVTFVSEKPLNGFKWNETAVRYELNASYVYSDGFYTNGVKLTFPEVDVNGWRVAHFEDEEGNIYSSLDGVSLLSDATLTAVWEKIDYTVSYEVNGETFLKTAHYGDAFVAPETEHAGYTFLNWQDENGNVYADLGAMSVTGSVAFKAVYEANVYTVTLVSDYELEGFVAQNGRFVKQIEYKYNTAVALPNGIMTGDYHLDGFALEAGSKTFYTNVPLLAENAELYAVWSKLGVCVTYLDENGETVATQNYSEGATLKNIPEVPAKTGYSGEWDISENFTVPAEDCTVQAVYAPNTYTVSVYSDFALAGYTACEEGFVRTYSYTYDTAPIPLATGDAMKVSGYDFDAYYTEKNGNGTPVTQIDNAIIDHPVLYVNQIYSTVTVTLWSDFAFEGGEKVLTSYKYKTDYKDGNYTLSNIAAAGYQQLGWFYNDNGTWIMLSDVSAYKGQSIEVWALWIQEIEVKITNFYTTDYKILGAKAGYHYNLIGEVRGGKVSGANSESIAKRLGLEGQVEAVFSLYNAKMEGRDGLDWGNSQKLDYNADGVAPFAITKATSAKYGTLLTDKASYGEAKITITFTYGGKTITTNGSDCVALMN